MVTHERLYPIQQIAEVLHPVRQYIEDPSATIRTVLYDSRKLADVEHGLFFALRARRDGHRYISDAYAAGVRNFIVQREPADMTLFSGANFIVVRDALRALQELAAYHRRRFTYPVIGITGSNGKTIVKEWLSQLLAPEYRIARSPKSYNSQIGVALSLWQLDSSFNLAIIEAGISRPGEMETLQRMIWPDMAVLTTIGPAHDAGFPSREAKIKEKLTLLAGAKQVVYSPQDTGAVELNTASDRFTWGEGMVDLRIMGCTLEHRRCHIQAEYQGHAVQVTLPFPDAVSRANACCCWSVMLALGYEQSVISERMALLQPIEMRLEMKRGTGQSTLIDDSYSNDLSSLAMALDFLRQQQQHTSRTLILSDIPDVADQEEETYSKVANLLMNHGINRLITIGPDLMKQSPKFGFLKHHAFPDTESFLAAYPGLGFQGEAILLKGARKYAFERISRVLTAKLHNTVLEINLSAVEHNLNQYRSFLPSSVKVMAMVKAFSYGSGSFEVANLLQFNHVDYLAVAYADEGVELRKAGITLPILVMSPAFDSYEALLAHRLEPEIYSFAVLEDVIAMLDRNGVSGFPIHIKVDTGMHRLGFAPNDTDHLAARLRETDTVRVQSVFSHLAAAGDPDDDAFTERQLIVFGGFADSLAARLPYAFIRHIANSAAIRRWPQAHLDMVRVGIGLYGADSAGERAFQLEQVSRLKTVITQIRNVRAGERVGYGKKGILTQNSKIATVNIGYADGYDRRFGGGVGEMMINDKAVRTVGDICMDMTMLDITGVDAEEGDEVLVFGDIDKLAKAIDTIPYELLASVSQRVKRVYYYG